MCAKAHELICVERPTILSMWVSPRQEPLLSAEISNPLLDLDMILSSGYRRYNPCVSLTGDPLEEIKSAKIDPPVHWGCEKAGSRWFPVPPADGPSIDLIGLANQVENMVGGYSAGS